VSDIFAVLSDPTRRTLIELLHGGERSVGDMVRRVDIEQPGVSRHLRILNDAGLVRVRRDGQRRLYSLRHQPLREAEEWVHRFAQDQAERIKRLAELVDEKEDEEESK
jgi:DNA-binding transcriptional ArsR family regulator